MPDDQQQQDTSIPIINAPHGDDDMMDCPQLCIVPASFVSGGDADRASVPFQSLSTVSQGELLNFLFRSALIGVFFTLWINDQPSQQRQRDSSLSRFPRKEKKMLMC